MSKQELDFLADLQDRAWKIRCDIKSDLADGEVKERLMEIVSSLEDLAWRRERSLRNEENAMLDAMSQDFKEVV